MRQLLPYFLEQKQRSNPQVELFWASTDIDGIEVLPLSASTCRLSGLRELRDLRDASFGSEGERKAERES